MKISSRRRVLLSASLLFLAIRPASAVTFTELDVFGDSTVDSGWWGRCPEWSVWRGCRILHVWKPDL